MNFEGAVTWAFEFEDQPYFAGFRVLSTNGIALPVLNVFRMFGLMGGKRLAVESTGEVGLEAIRKDGVRGKPDVSALASLRDGKVCVLAWHHHDDDVPGPDADVELTLSGLPAGGGPCCWSTSASTGTTATPSRRGSGWARPGSRRPSSGRTWSGPRTWPCWARPSGSGPRAAS